MAGPEKTLRPGHMYYLGPDQKPTIELAAGARPEAANGRLAPSSLERLVFSMEAPGRKDGEKLWSVRLPQGLPNGRYCFRIDLGDGSYDAPPQNGFYETGLRTLWLQDRQIFDYRPAEVVSASRVVRLDGLEGSRRPRRKIYIYLPRGYDERQTHRYPVLYTQDGQNIFDAFEEDSYVGAWGADRTADRLIASGQMRECVIVGVSHGGARRLEEYLPPGMKIQAPSPPRAPARKPRKPARSKPPEPRWITGGADRTFAFYQEGVAGWVRRNLRVSTLRDDTAVCGSSMGALFTLYVAFQHPEFARHYAALSPAFVATEGQDGRVRFFDLLRTGTRPDIRLWLDSGTLDAPGIGDDGLPETRQARKILLEQGFVEGEDLQFHIDRGAIHHESSWAGRLPQVFRFLFGLT